MLYTCHHHDHASHVVGQRAVLNHHYDTPHTAAFTTVTVIVQVPSRPCATPTSGGPVDAAAAAVSAAALLLLQARTHRGAVKVRWSRVHVRRLAPDADVPPCATTSSSSS